MSGVGAVLSQRLQRAWGEQAQVREVMVLLQSLGVPPALGVRIHQAYGEQALQVVRAEPYRLALDIPGIGFRTADRLAQALGTPPHSPQRAQAGLLFVVGQHTAQGHVHAPQPLLVERTRELLGLCPEQVEEALEALARDGHVVREALPSGSRAVFPAPLFGAEQGLAHALRALCLAPAPPLGAEAGRALEAYEREAGLDLAPEQRLALRRALEEKVLILTGGPGTGKTTLVRGLLRILERRGLRVLLAAPTAPCWRATSSTPP